MPFPHLVAVPCKLAQGMFPCERLLTIKLANGECYWGIVPRYFCWNAQGRLIAEEEPTDGAEGMVAARVVEEFDGYVAVEVPDGEVIAVMRSDVKCRPTAITPPG